MFWKKKNSAGHVQSEGQNLLSNKEASDPKMFRYLQENRRNSFRVNPSKTEPVTVQLVDEVHPVGNISAGGMSFEKANIVTGALLRAYINLPGSEPAISVGLQVVAIGKGDICHAKFIEVQAASMERIHQYVLKRQKEIIRDKKTKKRESFNVRSGEYEYVDR